MPRSSAFPKPPVGISQCLLGESVRYDAGHQYQPLLVTTLAPHLQWQAFCPEMAAGLGVPRPPVQLVASDGQWRARGRDNPHLDVTSALQSTATAFWQDPAREELAGFILKSRSPSCGLGSTPTHNTQGDVIGTGDGIFAAALKASGQTLATVEESWLNSESRCYRFLTACWVVWWAKHPTTLPAGLATLLQKVLQARRQPQQAVDWSTIRRAPEPLVAQLLDDQAADLNQPLSDFWRHQTTTPDSGRPEP